MANNPNAVNPTEASLGAAMSKTELFFENNGKALTLGLLVLVVLGGLLFGYRKLVSEPRAEKGYELLAQAQQLFEGDTPDYAVALAGDDAKAGFLEVIDRYGATPAGNLAYHYAGICYLKQGDLENAAKYLAHYDAVDGIPGAVINAQNLGLRGDIAVEQGDYKGAAALFEKAVKSTDNLLTAPLYLKKAGLAYKAAGQTAEARACFERIANEYPTSFEAREADKLVNAL